MERSFIMENSIAEEISKTDTTNDLQAFFNKTTAEKKPGATNNVAPSNSFWNATDDDFEKPKEKEKPKPDTEKPEVKPDKPTATDTDKTPGKVTEKMKLGSANTAVGMIDFTQRLLITPIHTYKLKKKIEKQFTADQLELVNTKLYEADEKGLEPEELRLKKTFDSLMTKYQKKVDKVAMDETEKKELHDAFYNYFDFTEKPLSPNWYLAMAIINSTGGKIMDAFTE